MHKHFYAASSYMGLNYTWDSPCWTLTAYDTAKERDAAVDADSNTMAVSLATARKICPWLRKCNPHDDPTGYYTYNTGRTVHHG